MILIGPHLYIITVIYILVFGRTGLYWMLRKDSPAASLKAVEAGG